MNMSNKEREEGETEEDEEPLERKCYIFKVVMCCILSMISFIMVVASTKNVSNGVCAFCVTLSILNAALNFTEMLNESQSRLAGVKLNSPKFIIPAPIAAKRHHHHHHRRRYPRTFIVQPIFRDGNAHDK